MLFKKCGGLNLILCADIVANQSFILDRLSISS
jgi:hypothetical protein